MLFDNGLTRMDRDTWYLVGNLQERYSVGRTRRKQSECLRVRRTPTDWPALCAINEGI